MVDSSIKIFCSNSNLTSRINKPTCYKSPDKPTCIDLILTNCLGSFQNSSVIETSLSDFRKIIVTIIKTSYRKIEPRVINYRDYKSFSNEGFRESLLETLNQSPFMNKTLSKAIMLRTKFTNKFLSLRETMEPLFFSSKENEKRVQ